MIAIMSNTPFEGLATRRRNLTPGCTLFARGSPVASMFVVIDGLVELVRHAEGGAALVLQRAGPGAVIAEASLFSPAYHCDAVARRDSVVESASVGELKAKLQHPEFAEQWMARLSHELQVTRTRAEILSLKTVAERLSAWLDVNGSSLSERRWVDVAAEIAVSPEALYRELARRRRGTTAMSDVQGNLKSAGPIP